MPMMAELCACGRPLHYTDQQVQIQMESLVDMLGSHVCIIVEGLWYRVQRHYIALHGMKANELEQLVEKGIVTGDVRPKHQN